jgi:hypothetical protein
MSKDCACRRPRVGFVQDLVKSFCENQVEAPARRPFLEKRTREEKRRKLALVVPSIEMALPIDRLPTRFAETLGDLCGLGFERVRDRCLLRGILSPAALPPAQCAEKLVAEHAASVVRF